MFTAGTERIPALTAGCEDYGLLYRLAENGQHPVIEVMADSEFLGEGPVFNTIARIPGTELPNEYIVLSAHFDSWDAASGATDDGTGAMTMLEAMRILQAAYPNPRTSRSSRDTGVERSRASTALEPLPPTIPRSWRISRLSSIRTTDGRIVNVSYQGLIGASGYLSRWFSELPAEFSADVKFDFPGSGSGQ